MDFLFPIVFACLVLSAALLLAVKAFGPEPVLDAVRLGWRGVNEIGRRLGLAARVLIGVHLDKDDVMEDLAEEIEERVSYRAQGRLTVLDNKLYALQERVTKLEKQARMVLPIGDDSNDE